MSSKMKGAGAVPNGQTPADLGFSMPAEWASSV